LPTLTQVVDRNLAFVKAIYVTKEKITQGSLTGPKGDRLKKTGSENVGEGIIDLISHDQKLVFQSSMGWDSLTASGYMRCTF
jgi:hypothetical protein